MLRVGNLINRRLHEYRKAKHTKEDVIPNAREITKKNTIHLKNYTEIEM